MKLYSIHSCRSASWVKKKKKKYKVEIQGYFMKGNSNALCLCYKAIIYLVPHNAKDFRYKVFKRACPRLGL